MNMALSEAPRTPRPNPSPQSKAWGGTDPEHARGTIAVDDFSVQKKRNEAIMIGPTMATSFLGHFMAWPNPSLMVLDMTRSRDPAEAGDPR